MDWGVKCHQEFVVYERVEKNAGVEWTMVASINTLYHIFPSKCNLNAYFNEFQEGKSNEFFMHKQYP